MSAHFRFLPILLFAWLIPSLARADVYGISTGQKELSAVDGKVFLIEGALFEPDWNLSVPGKDRPSTTTITLSSRKCPGLALAYDTEGKDQSVKLAKGGTFWKVVYLPEKRRYTIQAAEGKCKVWYLDIEKPEERKTNSGKRYTATRLILTEKPAKTLLFTINEIGK